MGFLRKQTDKAKRKFPRTPLPKQRGGAFEDKRKKEKYPTKWDRDGGSDYVDEFTPTSWADND